MKRRVLHFLMALGVLAAASPASAFRCASPCTMTQKQMLRCAQSCAREKSGAASIGKASCLKFESREAAQFTAAEQAPGLQPALGLALEPGRDGAVQEAAPGRELSRGPPLELQSYLQCGIPRSNAPPVLI
jgi:hypothetical protein